MNRTSFELLSSKEKLELLRDVLQQRLQLHNGSYRLDLRVDLLRSKLGKNTMQLRSPHDKQWPKQWRTTADHAAAVQWTREHYAEWILAQMEAPTPAPRRAVKVREVALRYIKSLESGALDSMEKRSRKPRISLVERHIIDTIGDVPLANLTLERVLELLSSLTAINSKTGERTDRPLAVSTKHNVVNALAAIWKAAFGDAAIPFKSARAKLQDDSAAWRGKVRQDEDLEALLASRKAYVLEELPVMLAAALFYDRYCSQQPNLRKRFVANTAISIALALTCGLRVSELVLLRWWHFDWKEGVLLVPGTKSKSALRRIPLQKALRPWFDRHFERERQRLGRDPHPNEPILQTGGKEWEPATVLGMLEYRWRRVAQIAEVKLPGKNTHAWRATYATLMVSSGKVPLAWVRHYIGHHNAFGDQTTTYIDVHHVKFDPAHAEVIDVPGPSAMETSLEESGVVNGFKPEWKPKAATKKDG